MKHNINLYLDELKPKRDYLSLSVALFVWGSAFLIMFVLYFSAQQTAEKVSARQALLKQDVEHKAIMVNEFESALKNRQEDPKLILQAQSLKRQLLQKQITLSIAQQKIRDNSLGYASLMADLSQYHEPNIWLTKIKHQQNDIQLYGMSAKAESIPIWLQKIANSGYFKGRQFKNLSLSADLNTYHNGNTNPEKIKNNLHISSSTVTFSVTSESLDGVPVETSDDARNASSNASNASIDMSNINLASPITGGNAL